MWWVAVPSVFLRFVPVSSGVNRLGLPRHVRNRTKRFGSFVTVNLMKIDESQLRVAPLSSRRERHALDSWDALHWPPRGTANANPVGDQGHSTANKFNHKQIAQNTKFEQRTTPILDVLFNIQ